MFDSLSDKLHGIFKKLRGESRLTESNVADALREIRLALLEADVNVEVAAKFIEEVKNSCLGQDVLKSVTPGQQMVRIVHDELVKVLGGGVAELQFKNSPSVIMLAGLHGSGKTTTAGKLALKLHKEGRRVLLVAGDVYRPAAIDQLETIGKEINVPVHAERTSVNVAAIAANAVKWAKDEGFDCVILDTAGRLQIDDTMIQELIRIRQSVELDEILLVADAALGQEAVSVADAFNKALSLTGFILTKCDGDARGGAALSIRQVTGVPVKFIGSGEKLEALEEFHPDRMAGRILGMGDVVSLVEKAAAEIDEADAKKLQEKLRSSKLDFNDFLLQMKQLSKLGGIEGVLKFLPGARQLGNALSGVDRSQFKRMEAMVHSMTPAERENPDLIDFSRRKRIARGCGCPVEMVSGFIKQFEMMRKMMRPNGMLGRMASGGAMPSYTPGVGFGSGAPQLSRKEQEHKKKLAKLAKKERAKQRRRKH